MRKRHTMPILPFFLLFVVFVTGTKVIHTEFKSEMDKLLEQSETLQQVIGELEEANRQTKEKLLERENYIQDLLQQIEDLKTIKARITAYAPFDNVSGICAEGNPYVTATGTKTRAGVAAVDPKKIPYGTNLFIPGYGMAVAEDTGGLIRAYNGVAIDVVMETYAEAMAWGVKYLDVKIQPRGR